MFNVGDLVSSNRFCDFHFGIVMKISDRTAHPDNPKVYAYQIYFANEKKRWLLEQDIELVSEAKTNV